MRKNSMEFKRRIYDLMNGSLNLEEYPVPESAFVKNEFGEGQPCSICYQKVFDANRRICERLGVDEDKDVEQIISGLLWIGEYQSMKMYDYGRFFSR